MVDRESVVAATAHKGRARGSYACAARGRPSPRPVLRKRRGAGARARNGGHLTRHQRASRHGAQPGSTEPWPPPQWFVRGGKARAPATRNHHRPAGDAPGMCATKWRVWPGVAKVSQAMEGGNGGTSPDRGASGLAGRAHRQIPSSVPRARETCDRGRGAPRQRSYFCARWRNRAGVAPVQT